MPMDSAVGTPERGPAGFPLTKRFVLLLCDNCKGWPVPKCLFSYPNRTSRFDGSSGSTATHCAFKKIVGGIGDVAHVLGSTRCSPGGVGGQTQRPVTSSRSFGGAQTGGS